VLDESTSTVLRAFAVAATVFASRILLQTSRWKRLSNESFAWGFTAPTERRPSAAGVERRVVSGSTPAEEVSAGVRGHALEPAWRVEGVGVAEARHDWRADCRGCDVFQLA
jgi:hypothetical protein